MQRHASLQALSREHHQALVLARRLRALAAPDAATSDHPGVSIERVQDDWKAEVAPHFAVEERELLPLCHGGAPDLVAHAESIRADHAAIRGMFTGLSPTSSASAIVALADRLDAHVRFEERVWFPALEAALDPDTLATLAWRLEREPQVPITGFHPDEGEPEGAWIASLACGHSQHIRHRPPFQHAGWVTTPEGRASWLGVPLPCRFCRMPRLPPAAACYKETRDFDERTVPPGLLASHTLRPLTWGQIVVLEGKVDYVIEGDPPLAFVLRPGVEGHVAPESPHHIRLQPGARFKVRFLR
jgi:tellurite methyltransferase